MSVEWAVVEQGFRRDIVVKGGLESREEAEAWLVALGLTTNRQDHDAFMLEDAIVTRGERSVRFREIGPWQRP